MPEVFFEIHYSIFFDFHAFFFEGSLHVFRIREMEAATQMALSVNHSVCRDRTIHDA